MVGATLDSLALLVTTLNQDIYTNVRSPREMVGRITKLGNVESVIDQKIEGLCKVMDSELKMLKNDIQDGVKG